MTRALSGVRVLDLADRSAALAGRVLADLGAEVILVEPPEGNPIRSFAPFLERGPSTERSTAHQYFSANKRSVVVDLGAESSRFDQLVATADVVIDTARPAQRSALGLTHGRLRAINPGLIQCSVTPFGLTTPWADRAACDIVAGAAGGLIWLSGEPRGTPVQGGAYPSYSMAGLIAASAISIALFQRDHSGAGSGVHIDLSLQEATAMAVMQTATPNQWNWHRRIPRRPGLSSALRCADGGHVGHMIRPDRFAGFVDWCDRVGIDHSLTVDDWQWARLDAPRQDNPVIAATRALAAVLRRDEFAAGALDADQVCLPVLGFDDFAATEQYRINEQTLVVEHPELGELGFVRSPVDGMAEPIVIRPAPTLGQDRDLLDDLPPVSVPELGAPATLGDGPDPARALEGVRVVDFGWVLAAPIGTRLLASFGAEVIRVESSAKPDSMRSQAGPSGSPDPDLGGLFNTVNAGKKSFAVDLSTEAGMDLVLDLVATADVVVNNFRPGALDRMGLGYEVLRERRPDIVLLNLPGAHRHGPWAKRPSMGNILMAASGFNMLTGFPHERPRGIGIAYPDFTGPHLLTTTVLAALRQRKATGQGQQIHLTQLTGMISLLGAEYLHFVASGEQPPRRANRDPNAAPHGVYPARASSHSDDEWIAVAVEGDDQWRSLCSVMSRPDLAADPRFADHAGRKANEDDLDALVGAFTAEHDKWELAERLQEVGVAAAAVEHLADMLERDPQLPAHYQTLHQPVAPEIDILVDREAARWVGHELDLTRAPGLGEHNQHVVCDLLGRTDEQYLDLVLAGVLT